MCQDIAHKKIFLLQLLAEAVSLQFEYACSLYETTYSPFVIQYNSEMFMSHFYDDSLEKNGKQVRIIGRYAGIIGRTMSIKE